MTDINSLMWNNILLLSSDIEIFLFHSFLSILIFHYDELILKFANHRHLINPRGTGLERGSKTRTISLSLDFEGPFSILPPTTSINGLMPHFISISAAKS